MDDCGTERRADRARVGVVPVRRHPVRRLPGNGERLVEELLRHLPVPRRAQPRVDQVPRAVDRAV